MSLCITGRIQGRFHYFPGNLLAFGNELGGGCKESFTGWRREKTLPERIPYEIQGASPIRRSISLGKMRRMKKGGTDIKNH
jgi:hypothetical protein